MKLYWQSIVIQILLIYSQGFWPVYIFYVSYFVLWVLLLLFEIELSRFNLFKLLADKIICHGIKLEVEWARFREIRDPLLELFSKWKNQNNSIIGPFDFLYWIIILFDQKFFPFDPILLHNISPKIFSWFRFNVSDFRGWLNSAENKSLKIFCIEKLFDNDSPYNLNFFLLFKPSLNNVNLLYLHKVWIVLIGIENKILIVEPLINLFIR